MKGRPGDPILEAVRAVSQVAPDVKITVDFNRHYETAAEFLPIGEALDEIGNMRTIEDPVGDLGELAKLNKSLKTPITLTAGGPARIIAGIQAEACRYINTGPSRRWRGEPGCRSGMGPDMNSASRTRPSFILARRPKTARCRATFFLISV